MPAPEPNSISHALEIKAHAILEYLARCFPVCTSSDEFHFFPQIPPGNTHWSRWDDFSEESISALSHQCREWRHSFDTLQRSITPQALQIDLQLMRRVLATLEEQITLLAVHEKQPTFYLTIMGIGLADAVAAGERALVQRLVSLPLFLSQAIKNLARVPLLFNGLGREMAGKLRVWLTVLPGGDAIGPALSALDQFVNHLTAVPADESFLPSTDVYTRIATAHIGCRVPMDVLDDELDSEIRDAERLLQRHAARLEPGQTWQAVVAGLTLPAADESPTQHYGHIIASLARHCVDRELIPAVLPQQCPVTVEAIPSFMDPVRSNAAFSALPGHPARGGTFFIAGDARRSTVPADYQLLAAHETYPGHHVLDASRWNLTRPLRRHLEFPLFYEGWASFSEELLFDTGFFEGPVADLLMAKRRFWRALRGRVDFNIHMRRQDLGQAAELLTAHGMAPERANAMVTRYTLKPGYQLAYAFGRRQFRRLYAMCPGARRAADFSDLILSQGEIEFDQLEMLLMQGGET